MFLTRFPDDAERSSKPLLAGVADAGIREWWRLAFGGVMTQPMAKETLINNATRFIQNNRGPADKTGGAIERILSR